tara:strand:- start:73 stop:363 length:291 start_codon:yes stop_codon:yes gene_type:complete
MERVLEQDYTPSGAEIDRHPLALNLFFPHFDSWDVSTLLQSHYHSFQQQDFPFLFFFPNTCSNSSNNAVDDILRTRVKTTGIQEAVFTFEGIFQYK